MSDTAATETAGGDTSPGERLTLPQAMTRLPLENRLFVAVAAELFEVQEVIFPPATQGDGGAATGGAPSPNPHA